MEDFDRGGLKSFLKINIRAEMLLGKVSISRSEKGLFASLRALGPWVATVIRFVKFSHEISEDFRSQDLQLGDRPAVVLILKLSGLRISRLCMPVYTVHFNIERQLAFPIHVESTEF